MPAVTPTIEIREVDIDAEYKLIDAGIPDILARLYASRGAKTEADVKFSVSNLISYGQLKGLSEAASILADAIQTQDPITVVADYDSDGATACATAVRGLKGLGANIRFVVPNRFVHGYGLTPSIVQEVFDQLPDTKIILTVDNGIASNAGVDKANELGMRVVVTDHHLPGDVLPKAAAIVNPQQPGCPFPSKNLAGCGVMFYTLFGVKAELAKRGIQAQVDPLVICYVALGTIADVVSLDRNNRILVQSGLDMIHSGRMPVGMEAMFKVASKFFKKANSQDFAFSLGPMLNAAGRLDDMAVGIRCLLAESPTEAMDLAEQLFTYNVERKRVERAMKEEALAQVPDIAPSKFTCVAYSPDFHQGVIGIVASRLKDQYFRPTLVFADASDGLHVKGSGRSIPSLHLRDALDIVYKKYPGIIPKFGGHAAAAGVEVVKERFEEFKEAFELACSSVLEPSDLDYIVQVDGDFSELDYTIENAELINTAVWGQHFPVPLFYNEFEIIEAKVVGKDRNHLNLQVKLGSTVFKAMWFFQEELPDFNKIKATFTLNVNEFKGNKELSLFLQHVVPEREEVSVIK